MTNKKERSRKIVRTSMIGIAANVILAAFKAIVGILASSVAIVMDAINNLSDVLSSVVTIIGIKLSQQPADTKHPYGHGRVEYFSAIIISVIVIIAGVTATIESIKKILDPVTPEYSLSTLIVIIAAIVVKLLLGRYVKRQGELLNSDALIASGADALFDAILTFSTLISVGIMLIWNISIDGILGVIISAYIIKAGIDMLSKPVNELLGTRIPAEIINCVKQEVMSFEGVQGVFDIILHNYGNTLMIGSLHINVSDSMTAYEIHGLTRRISEKMFHEHGIILTIGIYSVFSQDTLSAKLQSTVLQAVSKYKEILQTHGFYYNDRDRSISIDIVPDLTVTDEQALAGKLQEELKTLLPDYTINIVVDHNYSE